MKLTLCGVGALGSHFLQFIRNENVEINVIDNDRVDSTNTLSQFYGRSSVGKLKVESMKQMMDFLYKKKITTNSNRLTEYNVEQLLGGADLIVDTFDNAASRSLVQAYARAYDITCVHGALAAGGAFGRVFWTEGFVIDSEVGAGAATCANGEFLSFITLTASYLAQSVHTFLGTGKKVGYSISPGGAFAI